MSQVFLRGTFEVCGVHQPTPDFLSGALDEFTDDHRCARRHGWTAVGYSSRIGLMDLYQVDGNPADLGGDLSQHSICSLAVLYIRGKYLNSPAVGQSNRDLRRNAYFTASCETATVIKDREPDAAAWSFALRVVSLKILFLTLIVGQHQRSVHQSVESDFFLNQLARRHPVAFT